MCRCGASGVGFPGAGTGRGRESRLGGRKWRCAVADEMIARRDDAGEGETHRSPADLRQDDVEGGALPVAGHKDGNVVLVKARMPGRSASFAKPCAADRTGGP